MTGRPGTGNTETRDRKYREQGQAIQRLVTDNTETGDRQIETRDRQYRDYTCYKLMTGNTETSDGQYRD